MALKESFFKVSAEFPVAVREHADTNDRTEVVCPVYHRLARHHLG
jgi:hypothetical protein